MQLLSDFGASPTLNLIQNYERDDELNFISTDVYSFHVDRSPIPTDTFLCTYHGAASEILPNDQVEQKILIPEIREKLFKDFSVHDKFHRTLILSGFCLLKIAKISLNSSFSQNQLNAESPFEHSLNHSEINSLRVVHASLFLSLFLIMLPFTR
jgi:hypothetical protein